MTVREIPYKDLRKGRHDGRAFIWDAPTPEESHGMARPPYSMKGDDLANDALWRKYNHIEVANQRAVLMTALTLAGFKPTRVVWNDKAGCSCGCSKGFNLRGLDLDLYINVLKAAPAAQGVAA
jgi:hypothetical protein